MGQVYRRRRHLRSILDRCRHPLGEGAAVHAPAGTGSTDDAVLGNLLLDHCPSTTRRRSGSISAAIRVRQRPHSQAPVNRTITRRSGASTKARVTPLRPGCPPGLRPLGFRCERGGDFLNGGSEEGGLLELWLSWAKRASNSRMRSCRCSMSVACATTSARRRLSSLSGLSGGPVGLCCSGIILGYLPTPLLGKGS